MHDVHVLRESHGLRADEQAKGLTGQAHAQRAEPAAEPVERPIRLRLERDGRSEQHGYRLADYLVQTLSQVRGLAVDRLDSRRDLTAQHHPYVTRLLGYVLHLNGLRGVASINGSSLLVSLEECAQLYSQAHIPDYADSPCKKGFLCVELGVD